MKRFPRFVSRLLPMLLISLVIGGTAWSWNARALGGNAMPMPFGVGLSVVLSGSMEPTLSVGDLVVIRAQDSYEPGDVVVYQEEDQLVIHRLIDCDGGMALTRGDANNTADEPIELSQIKGRMLAAVPGVGTAVRFLQTLPGTLAVLLLAVWLLLRSWRSEDAAANEELDAIRREIEELKKERAERE